MGKVSLLRDQFFFSPTCEISKGDCEVVCLLRPNKAAFLFGREYCCGRYWTHGYTRCYQVVQTKLENNGNYCSKMNLCDNFLKLKKKVFADNFIKLFIYFPLSLYIYIYCSYSFGTRRGNITT